MSAKRKKKPEKFTDMLRPWIVAHATDGNVVIGKEVIEGLPPQGAVGNN
jgi:hypothetical protein